MSWLVRLRRVSVDRNGVADGRILRILPGHATIRVIMQLGLLDNFVLSRTLVSESGLLQFRANTHSDEVHHVG